MLKEGRKIKKSCIHAMIAGVCIIMFILIHLAQDSSPFKPSAYNTYTLQALQWREGKIALDEDVPHLELAIYQGRYYVSFPPVPTVPVFLLTFIFGSNVPDTLLVQLYALIACLALYDLFRRRFGTAWAAALAFFTCFASSLLPLLQNGAVWYQAQAMAFMLTVLSMALMQRGKATWSLLAYALSVGCRPFNALYGPMLMLYGLLRQKQSGRRLKQAAVGLMPGIGLGLAVAVAYSLYNTVRFGHPLEFGHNYLPEFSFQGGTQFSFSHIARNARIFLLAMPFEQTESGLRFRQFGFSLFLANPIFMCFFLWIARDLILGRMTWFKAAVVVTFAIHILLLLSHRTMGGYQYGARYMVDCIPYVALYLAIPDEGQLPGRVITTLCGLLLGMGFIMALAGAQAFRLPA
jgi:hypothetical protein